MVNFVVAYDKDVLEAVRSRILNRPNAVQIYMEKTVPVLVRRKLSPILKEPRRPDLPFIWSYDPAKQRRAQRWYFANKAKGRIGGRFVRTHALVNNWEVVAAKIRDGSILTISNDTPGLDYVQGPRQVPSHKDSGWAEYDDVLLKAEKYANDLVVDFWLKTEI